MSTRRQTPFERRLTASRKNARHDRAFQKARSEVDAVDDAVRTLLREVDAAREKAHLSKAALAERVGLPPETIRRLLTADAQNPTVVTLMKLARALGFHITLVRPRKASRSR